MAPFTAPRAGAEKELPDVAAVKASFGNALASLPGVIGISGNDRIVISTQTVQQAQQLRALLRDSINGTAITFESFGRAVPPTPPEYLNAAQVLERYGNSLRRLPHVRDVTVLDRNLGPMLPAFEKCVVVHVDRTAALKYRSMLRDCVNGVSVRVEPRTCFPAPR